MLPIKPGYWVMSDSKHRLQLEPGDNQSQQARVETENLRRFEINDTDPIGY
uniref:Uncharacterized protein n=1 Tax=Rheinheimera sp. BAL341 TaxID=1708203 RepID=A0A486XMX1_9GAMM